MGCLTCSWGWGSPGGRAASTSKTSFKPPFKALPWGLRRAGLTEASAPAAIEIAKASAAWLWATLGCSLTSTAGGASFCQDMQGRLDLGPQVSSDTLQRTCSGTILLNHAPISIRPAIFLTIDPGLRLRTEIKQASKCVQRVQEICPARRQGQTPAIHCNVLETYIFPAFRPGLYI